MRRLAKQSREDIYKSRRDYQTLYEKISLAVVSNIENTLPDLKLVLINNDPVSQHSNLVGFGGFIYPSCDCILNIILEVDSIILGKKIKLKHGWNRFGFLQSVEELNSIKVEMIWSSSIELSFWGLNANFIQLPESILSNNPSIQDLEKTHLAPETFYLSHESSILLEIQEEASSPIRIIDGAAITVKKCSYCERLLPLDMQRLGALSFHKHNSKLTNHQNECRACKKWRINNSFNPLRTTDQLHESSVITRERKFLLREPEILQEIKQRTGAGLKSQVWERFGRKCFYCEKLLNLDQVQLDHTRPLAYLWPIDEHATCLCADHNNQKKEKFPIEFYSEEQLKRLSIISGLPYEELCKKELNNNELQRILVDLPRFTKEWEPRTFAAIARKISELRDDINLFEILAQSDQNLYQELIASLSARPLSVGED